MPVQPIQTSLHSARTAPAFSAAIDDSKENAVQKIKDKLCEAAGTSRMSSLSIEQADKAAKALGVSYSEKCVGAAGGYYGEPATKYVDVARWADELYAKGYRT